MLDRLMPTGEVLKVLGIGRTTLHRMVVDGQFPAAVTITKGRVGWPQSEVESWVQSRVEGRKDKATGG